ncbi:hypothetical protein J9317_04100 [Metabacillus sp. KIGAM252]|uniref:Uncharacterized protein n=1 Tax=Metabacillus flavus TaxID=2823519 RepID=A0ABS5LB59_9BACI|nr:hypothetical protein [Metabacillus flavus]MBS2967957.1 hypothetical protein [Metabacillus flavus]
MPGKNARQTSNEGECQGRMPGKPQMNVNARQECQATMPGKHPNMQKTPLHGN